MNHKMLGEALRWQALGYSPVPTAVDGSKSPAIPWGRYIKQPATPENVQADFQGRDTDGLGLVCGAASSGLEMVEIEGRAIGLLPAIIEASSSWVHSSGVKLDLSAMSVVLPSAEPRDSRKRSRSNCASSIR